MAIPVPSWKQIHIPYTCSVLWSRWFSFPQVGCVIVSCKVLLLYTSIMVFFDIFDDFCLVLKFLKGFCSFSPTKRQDSQVGFVKKRHWSFWGLNLFWHLDAENSRENILKITRVLVRKILETCYLPVEFYWELRHGQVAWHFFRAKNCSFQTFGKMVGFKKKTWLFDTQPTSSHTSWGFHGVWMVRFLWSSHTEPKGGDNGCLGLGMRQSYHGNLVPLYLAKRNNTSPTLDFPDFFGGNFPY